VYDIHAIPLCPVWVSCPVWSVQVSIRDLIGLLITKIDTMNEKTDMITDELHEMQTQIARVTTTMKEDKEEIIAVIQKSGENAKGKMHRLF